MTDNIAAPKHEYQDANGRFVFYAGIAFSIFILFAAALVGAIYVLSVVKNGRIVSETVLPPQEAILERVYQEPRLQVDPAIDLDHLRAEENELLERYGWIDPKNGIARIPIDKAIEIVAEQRLPHRKP